MAVRDAWIGWDDATRERNLSRVVNNSRFLILPWVRVENLASRVLSLALGRLAAEWLGRYGVAVLLVETKERRIPRQGRAVSQERGRGRSNPLYEDFR